MAVENGLVDDEHFVVAANQLQQLFLAGRPVLQFCGVSYRRVSDGFVKGERYKQRERGLTLALRVGDDTKE